MTIRVWGVGWKEAVEEFAGDGRCGGGGKMGQSPLGAGGGMAAVGCKFGFCRSPFENGWSTKAFVGSGKISPG